MITTEPISSDRFFDLIVIGSGPAALAVVTRILESRPAALYTEEEHQHLHWLRRRSSNPQDQRPQQREQRRFLRVTQHNGKKMLVDTVGKAMRNGQEGKQDGDSSLCECEGVMKILVIDKLGGWMANWDRLFKAYEIPHLRSPMFFHPAPSDLDALVAFAERFQTMEREQNGKKAGREQHLIEVTGCVGKEISKHRQKKNRLRVGKDQAAGKRASEVMGPAVNERERKDYFTPSTRLFREFCRKDLVERYGLENQNRPWPNAKDFFDGHKDGQETSQGVQHVRGEVKQLDWTTVHVEGWDTMQGFCVDLNDGTRLAAKAVVCATGPGVSPSVPKYLQDSSPESTNLLGPGWIHSTQIGLPHRTEVLPAGIGRQQRYDLVVIGGGLTSAQLCDVAIRKNPSVHVTLIIRRHLQIKPFDVGLQWVGRYANLEKMQFWQEDDPQQRWQKILDARNGGSVTPRYAKLLRQYEQQGRLTILTCTSVENARWHVPGDEEEEETDAQPESASMGEHRWTLDLCTNVKMAKKQSQEEGEEPYRRSKMQADYVIAATGAAPNLATVGYLKGIRDAEEVGEYGGLPYLTEDLQYGTRLPLFFTGAFSALHIGPAAFNLEGMRAAADRIVIRLQEMTTSSLSPSLLEQETSAEDGSAASEKKETHVQSRVPPSHYTHFAYHLLPQEVEA